MQVLPKIPGYQLLQCLGGGPMTCVYSAQDCETGRACAVKLLRDEWCDPSTAIQLLQREARAGLSVRHPHVVRLLNGHVLRPPHFLVMEFLGGESLRRRLRREYRLDLATTVWIARQTAEGLAALHRAGFMHGDVKPDNVRLVDDGTAVLLDLGFAHRPGENAALLEKGYVLGTINYLAPELCAFQPERDCASDLYSLGIMLYEMLTGRLPYPAGTVEQTMKRHCHDEPDDLRTHALKLPAGLVNLVERLLARDPAERPRASLVVQQLVALEIAALRCRRAA